MQLPLQTALLQFCIFFLLLLFTRDRIAGDPRLPFPHRYIYLHIFILPLLFILFSDLDPIIFYRAWAALSPFRAHANSVIHLVSTQPSDDGSPQKRREHESLFPLYGLSYKGSFCLAPYWWDILSVFSPFFSTAINLTRVSALFLCVLLRPASSALRSIFSNGNLGRKCALH